MAMALALALAACGSTATEPGAASDAASAVPASQAASEPSAAAESSAAAEPGGVDGSGIDWATVDLTTIDWGTIDLRTVDWLAAQDNPTAADLGPELTGLIQSRMNRGSATLTIGDQVWQFDSFDCASGHENTRSDAFSFTTNSMQQFETVTAQMQFTIEDPTSSGRLDGDGVFHRIDFDDVSDFENPSISWAMSGAGMVSVDGYDVSVSGAFDDGLTDGVVEEIPGTLEAVCSDMSRF
jgi:hypothetical protein